MKYAFTAILDRQTSVTGTVEAESHQAAAQRAWEQSNDTARTEAWRSLSVGDVVKVQDGESTYCFVCLPIGWMTVESDFVDHWVDIPVHERMIHPLMHTEDPLDAMLIRKSIMGGENGQAARIPPLPATLGRGGTA